MGFFGVLAFLLINLGMLYANIQQARGHQNQVIHTHSVLNELEELMSDLKDAETYQRGYILSGDRAYLEPYEAARAEIGPEVARLRELTVDNPEQTANLEILSQLINKRLDILARNLQLYSNSERVSPSAFSAGNEAMSAVRVQAGKMRDLEHALLDRRSHESRDSFARINISFGLAALLNILLLSVSFYFVRRYLLQQARALIEQERETWIRAAQTEIANAVSGSVAVPALARKTLQVLAVHLDAPAANFYAVELGELQLVASLASSASTSPTRVRSGEGLLGEAVAQGKIHRTRRLPDGYMPIASSLGRAAPRELLIVPIIHEGATLGAMEFATWDSLDERQIEMIERIRETLATGLNTALSRARLQELYEETQRQAEELQSQQEELRVTNEELVEQTRSLTASRERLQVQQEELSQSNEELEQQTRILETQKSHLTTQNETLEAIRRQIEQKTRDLELTNQYKSEFLAKMSHELRTPLNSLLILASLLLENKEGNLKSQQIDFIRTMRASGNDLLQLINDILDLSKLEARRLRLNPEDFELGELLESLERSFRPLADDKQLKLDFTRTDAPALLHSDRQRLEQILRNLLSNAIKFTAQGEVKLDVRAGSDPSRIVFTVTDTGIGIPTEKQRLIFEAFQQVDSSTSRKYGGTGLGLTISRELAQMLGGRIGVESQPGQGARFELEIPVRMETPPEITDAEPIAPPAPPPASALRAPPVRSDDMAITERAADGLWGNLPDDTSILIVEDDPDFAAILAEITASLGFSAVKAGSGEIALALLQKHQPRAILLDIKLPGISGLTVLERIKANPKTRHIPTHVISGLDRSGNALKLGAVGYLVKPASRDDIEKALGRIEDLVSRRMKRVLIIEDDPIQLGAIEKLIGGGGVETLAANTGEAAIATLRQGGFDCMILDLSLPDISGFDLLDRLSREPQLALPPVVIYTARDLSPSEEQRLRRYSDSIIIKGARSPERLFDEVNLFLHRIESELPAEKRELLKMARGQEKGFEGRTILLVDDDLRNVFALTSALESAKFRVVIGRNGLEALEALRTEPGIELILMDIMMPRMDGFEAIRRIRALGDGYAKMPIIALTAKAMKGDHERCLEAGANDYLPKPIDLSSLFSLLRVWLPERLPERRPD